MDLFKPFKNLFNRLVAAPVARYVEQQFDENDHRPKKTAFEMRLLEAFDTCERNDQFKAVRVSILPQSHAGDRSVMYEDPRTGTYAWGSYDVGLVGKNEPFSKVIKEYNDHNFTVVMMLDPKLAPIEEQIPGWKEGSLDFPDRFLSAPLITVALENHAAAQLPPAMEFEKMAVGQMHTAIGCMPNGKRRAMPHYIRGVIDGGRSFNP